MNQVIIRFTIIFVWALMSCGETPVNGWSTLGKDIKVYNRSSGTVEVLLAITSYRDSIVELRMFQDTIVTIPYNEDSLRVRRPYGKTIRLSIEEHSLYKPLIIESQMFR